jgi:WD40 repeat protein
MIRFFDADRSSEIGAPLGPVPAVEALCFGLDSNTIWVVEGGFLELWDRSSQRQVSRHALPSGSVVSPVARVDAFSPNRELLVLQDPGGPLFLWDIPRSRQRALLQSSALWTRATFSPDSKLLAVSFRQSDGAVKVWDTETGHEVVTLKRHRSWVAGLDFSPDGRMLATGGYDQTIKLWDTTAWIQLETLRGHLDEIYDLAFSPDGKHLATAGKDGTVRLWSAAPRSQESARFGLTEELSARAFSPTGDTFVTVSGERVRLFALPSFQPLSDGMIPARELRATALSPTGAYLALAGGDGSVEVFNTQTWKLSSRFSMQAGQVATWLAFAPRGNFLAGVDRRTGEVRVWDRGTNAEVSSCKAHDGGMRVLAFSPDGKLLATGGEDRTAKLWDPLSVRQVGLFSGHKAGVTGLAFSRDGRRLATTSVDGTTRLWDISTQVEIAVLRGQLTSPFAVSFSPNGQRIVVGSGDGPLKLYDPVRKQELAALGGLDFPGSSFVAFVDEQTIVADGGTNVWVWKAEPPANIGAGKARTVSAGR